MSLRRITDADGTYQFRTAHMAAAGHRMRAILRARLVDELTGLGVADAYVTSDVEDLLPRVSNDGVVGLVGNPGRMFSALATASIDIDVTFAAPGYLARQFTSTMGPFNTALGDPADFPLYFAPVDLGDVAMHLTPVTLQGRVMSEMGTTRTPLANADVTLLGVWTVAPGPDDNPDLVIEAADMLSLANGVYAPRPAVGANISVRAMQIGPANKVFLRGADQGATHVDLSDRVGLVVGDVLALDPSDPDHAEFIEITAVDGGLTAAEPARVTLAHPLAWTHRQGTDANPASAGPVLGAPAPLLRDAIPKDQVLHLTGIPAALAASGTLEISGGGVPAEYHRATRYQTQSDALGDWRLPPISRVAHLRLQANRADFVQPLILDVQPAYSDPVQTLDFLLRL